MYKWFSILALVLFSGCAARPSRIDLFKEPQFNIRPIGPNAFAVTAKSVREILERLGCGVDVLCQVGHGGEVFVARTGDDQLLIQVPMKTPDQLAEEIGCGPKYVCSVTHTGQVMVVKRKD